MKNRYKSMMAVAMVAMAFVSCSKENVSDIVPVERKVTMTIIADNTLETQPSSRTMINEESGKFSWSQTGEVITALQTDGTTLNKAESTGYQLADDGKASFDVELNEMASATYSAVYPSTNYKEPQNSNTGAKEIRVDIPSEQTPAATSFDPKADLLLAKPQAIDELPTSLSMRFFRMAAIGKLTLDGVITPGEKIATIELSTDSKNISGYSKVDLETGTIVDIGYYGQKAIKLNLNGREATGSDVAWFTSLPCELTNTDQLTLKVSTDKATYQRTITPAADRSLIFASSKLTKLTVNNSDWTRIENIVDEYTLLTDASLLNVGDQIVITNIADNKALSTTQNTNNRGTTDVTVTDSKITDIGSDIQILEVQAGSTEGTFAFYTGAGYLYAAGSNKNNRLRTEPTLSGNSSWKIEIAASGEATITAQGNNTNNVLRYNNSSTLFACYSLSSTQQAVHIYHKAGAPKTPLNAPQNVEAALLNDDPSIVSVAWDPVAGAASYTVSFSPADLTAQVVEETGELSYLVEFPLQYSTEYTISVVANPTDKNNYKSSEASTTTITTGENPNEVATFDLTTTVLATPSSGINNLTGDDAFYYDNTDTPNVWLHFEKGTGSSEPYYYKSTSSGNTQISGGNTMSITAAEGKTILKIEITTSAIKGTASCDKGTFDSSSLIWTGNENSVVFTVSGTSTSTYLRMTKVVVTYK